MNWYCSLVSKEPQTQPCQIILPSKFKQTQNVAFASPAYSNTNEKKSIDYGLPYFLSKGLNKKKTSLRQGSSQNKKNLSHNQHHIAKQRERDYGINLASPQNYLSSVKYGVKVQQNQKRNVENYTSSAAYKFHSPQPINFSCGNSISARTNINLQSREIASKSPFISYQSRSNTQSSQIGKNFHPISSPQNFRKTPIVHQHQKVNQPFHYLSQPALSLSSTRKNDGKQNRMPMNPSTRQFSIQEEPEENDSKNQNPKLKIKRKIEDFLKSKELVTSVRDSQDSSSSDKSEYLGRVNFRN